MPRTYGLPVFVSLLLHGVVFGTLLLLSVCGRTATCEIGSVSARNSMVVTLVTLPPDAEEPKTAPGAAPVQPEKLIDVSVGQLPIRADTPHDSDVGPVVSSPGSLPGNSVSPAKRGSGASGLGQAGGRGGSVFAPAPTAKSVVYVIDRSGSMGQHDAFRCACGEVVADLSQWPETTRFQVVPYNSHAEPLCINASVGLLPLNADTVREAQTRLSGLRPTGWTDHLSGLRSGLILSPDVLYLVTDADDLKPEDVRAITTLNHGRTVIHTIELSSRYSAKPTGTLAQLASTNRGTYRRVLLEE